MHGCEPGLVNGFSQACVPSTSPSGVTVVCKLREGKGKRQAWVRGKGGRTLLWAVRPQGTTHSYGQTPTVPLCPESLRPSEIPLSVGRKAWQG